MSDQITDTVKALEALVSQHQKQLENNPDFKAIQTLERTIRELRNGHAIIPYATYVQTDTGLQKKLSQPAAAKQALIANGAPMATRDLLQAINALGVHVGGDKPWNNLVSILSGHNWFKSVSWQDGTAWWLSDVPVPRQKGDHPH